MNRQTSHKTDADQAQRSAVLAGDYPAFARERLTQAREQLDRHVTSAYTGVCLACGRPGPCDDRLAALDVIARYAPSPPAPPDPTATALAGAVETLDTLRAATAATVAAVDRASYHLYGTSRPDQRLIALHRAVADTWQALGDVYAGLHAARDLPSAPPASIGHLLAGLRAARADVDRAAALAATARQRLTVAADRLRRTSVPAAVAAATRFETAISRLDRSAARLAVGDVTIDRYAAGLTVAADVSRPAGAQPPKATRPARSESPNANRPAGADRVAEVNAGVRHAVRLVAAARRRRHPSLLDRVRHHLRTETPR